MQSTTSAALQLPPMRSSSEDLFDALRARREEILVELNRLDHLIALYTSEPAKADLNSIGTIRLQDKPKQRVRGVLAAARKAIDELTSPFDKNQLLEKLVEIDNELAKKKITGANIRNALRMLTQAGLIRVESKATATTCAQYITCPKR